MTLSYDFAFLALVRLAATDTPLVFKQRRCIAHPLTKRAVLERNGELDFCSCAAAILSYHKIKDDLSDERGFKRLQAVCMLPFVSSWRKKAVKRGFSELDGSVSEYLRRLSELEKNKAARVGDGASVFGALLSELVSFGLEGSSKRIVGELGRYVGRWIYTVDALDDAKEDAEKGRYNPFILLYDGRLPQGEELELICDGIKAELVNAEMAMDLMEINETSMRSIIENILYLGLPDTVEKIICERYAPLDKDSSPKERKCKI